MKKRVVYFDYLRVIATMSVALAHISTFHWSDFSGRSLYWNIFNFFVIMIRWAVPVFVMLSGALFLSKDVDIKKLYKKNVLRMVVVYLAWGAFYTLVFPLYNWIRHGEPMLSLGEIILGTVSGSYHMWFIPMVTGLYICAPVIRKIVQDRKIAMYFVSLAFVFVFLFPGLVQFCYDFGSGWLLKFAEAMEVVVSFDMQLSFVAGYTVYFILGYLLETTELTKKQRTIIYILGIAGFISALGLNSIVAWKTSEPCSTYYEAFCTNTFFSTIAVHTWFKYRDYPNEKLNQFVFSLSKYSFGVYLVHAFVLDILDILGMTAITWHPAYGIPFVSLLAIIMSFGFSWVIHKIPVLNKWIV